MSKVFNRHKRWSRLMVTSLAMIVILSQSSISFAQDDNSTGISGDVAPSPASIGADVPLTYFGPPPSEVQRELIGPYQLLKAGKVDQDAGTVTLPLYKGQMEDGTPLWYILTDTNDKANADALGLNFSAKLTYANVGNGARQATLETDGSLTFNRGTVDFSPLHAVSPGTDGHAFPPAAFTPGSEGDAAYSPLAVLTNGSGYIYNAPIVAFGVEADQINFCDGNVDHTVVHDKVLSICPDENTVTLQLTAGFSFARPVLYLSMDANDPMAAAMEGATLAPGMKDILVGRDDGAFSAVERIFAFANGPTGKENPQRQGFDSALSGEGMPLNVLGGIPTVATDYSPLWDLNLGVWTQAAIDNHYTSRMTEEFAILGMAQKGWLTGPDGNPFGSTGIIINCPIVFRFL